MLKNLCILIAYKKSLKEKKEASAKRKKENEDKKVTDEVEEADEGDENEKENEDDVMDEWTAVPLIFISINWKFSFCMHTNEQLLRIKIRWEQSNSKKLKDES